MTVKELIERLQELNPEAIVELAVFTTEGEWVESTVSDVITDGRNTVILS